MSSEAVRFVSKNSNYRTRINGIPIQFIDGMYISEDAEIIEMLRKSPFFNKDFTDNAPKPAVKSLIVNTKEKPEYGFEDARRLGYLEGKLLNDDGKFKPAINKEKYAELIKELEDLRQKFQIKGN